MTFIEWVQVVRDKLGLTDWEIKVYDGPLAEDVIANVVVPSGRRVAKITLGPQFYEEDAEGKRDTIVHELLHCHFADLDEIQSDTLPILLGKPTFTTYQAATDLALEHGIDAIAVAIGASGVIPLPPEDE